MLVKFVSTNFIYLKAIDAVDMRLLLLLQRHRYRIKEPGTISYYLAI